MSTLQALAHTNVMRSVRVGSIRGTKEASRSRTFRSEVHVVQWKETHLLSLVNVVGCVSALYHVNATHTSVNIRAGVYMAERWGRECERKR